MNPPRPTTEEGRTDPLLRPHDESEGEPRSSTGSTGNDAHKTESDQRGTAGRDVGTLSRPTTEEGRLLERARRALAIAYLDQNTDESARESFLTAEAIEDYQKSLAAPPSEQEEPPAPHRCTATAGRCEKESGHDGDHYTEYRDPVWTHRAASTPVPALDRNLLAEAMWGHQPADLRDTDTGSLHCGRECADSISGEYDRLRRLSGDEGADHD